MAKKSDRDAFWLAKGYVSVSVAAEKTKRHVGTVHRAIKAGELEYQVDGGYFKFVSIKSLVKWIGTDTAKAYGLIPR